MKITCLPFLKIYLLLLFALQVNGQLKAQPITFSDTTSISTGRMLAIAGGSAVVYAGSLVFLNQVWYKDVPRTGFHFFNDNGQWLQLDKAGHMLTAFHESRFGVDAMRWAGASRKQAIWAGGMLGFVLQSPIEILDGYAADYGASWGDLAANAAGSGLVIGQLLAWDELRITPRFSFQRTRFARERPNVLGSNLQEEILKDYNGQTYWLAFNVKSFLPRESRWPSWLGVAAGYGGSEMVYNDPDTNRAAGFSAHRQFYLAPAFNLRSIKTRSKALKVAFYLLDVVHLPAPALEFSKRNGFKVHGLYF